MKINHLIGLITCVVLASCMPSNTLMIPSVTTDMELVEANSGILLIQVADTTPFGAAYPANQITLAPKDVNESDITKFLRLESAESNSGSTRFFYSVVPANEYSLRSLRSYYQFGDSYFSQFYPAGIELGTFVVEPGKITDLGVLAIYIGRNGEDYHLETIRTPSVSRAADQLMAATPELLARVKNANSPLTWAPDANDSERHEDYVNAVNRQIVFADPFVSNEERLMKFPSRLGVVVERNDNGEWGLDAIPSDSELRQVTVIDQRDVVVTEFDEILHRADRHAEWEMAEAPPGPGKLVYIGAHPDAGVFAVRQEPDSVTIWSAPAFGSTWSQVTTIAPELSFFQALDKNLFAVDQDIQGADYITEGDYLYLALRRSIFRVALPTGTVEELDVSKAESLQIRNGVITTRAPGSTTASRVSFDAGMTWRRSAGKFVDQRAQPEATSSRRFRRQELFAAKFVGHPIFLDRERGFALHEGEKSDDPTFLIATEDGAKTWIAADEAPLPTGCSRLLTATVEELLLSCFLSGEVYRSTDSGKSWELDRATTET